MNWIRDRFLRPAAGGTIPHRFTPDPDLVPVRLSEGVYLGPIGAGTDLADYFDVGYILDDGLTAAAYACGSADTPPLTSWGDARTTITITRGTPGARANIRRLLGLRVRARHLVTKQQRIRAMRTAYRRRHRYSHHR